MPDAPDAPDAHDGQDGRGAPDVAARSWRLPSLLRPPIGFAHRGARALERENTLAAFTLALRLGATGLETDVWLTADGTPVLDHDGRVGGLPRRRPIAAVERAALPAHIPTLAELYEACGPDLTLSIDVKDPAAAGPVLQVATAAGADLTRLYLCAGDVDDAARFAALDPSVRAVHSVRLRRLRPGPERYVAGLAERGVHVVNMPYPDWSGGLVALCHRFGILAFGWDAHHAHQIVELLRMGCDAVYSDHPERLADAIGGGQPGVRGG
ncbi:MAG: glycerophosphodiester phosphodiesterase [Acidimicrobiia bacterium]